ncbi:hypothetical protein N658DRAFT_491108 [Parathielavia hyrcaniae]|uniref:Uncharacterized protein n=1 Tax=Parathielavia hyrcaniae TaxID=113614 RepID=A0AAN6QA98_9PEZI|nr:hypothetical protein N658DRAFT_491108 [Parathielavia hyrcaniae]
MWLRTVGTVLCTLFVYFLGLAFSHRRLFLAHFLGLREHEPPRLVFGNIRSAMDFHGHSSVGQGMYIHSMQWAS